tara:strand:+ start:190 stop:576 length:387 start_codon:yes stop_codon:yes gene_type:complete
MKRKDVVSLAAERAFDALGFRPGKSRLQRTVQKRMAIAMAMKPYCNNYEIAEVLLRDRSVVYHYLQNHDNYIQHWDGYKELYDIAKIAVTDVLADYDINQKIFLLESQITKLVLARDEIKKKFEEATS